MRKPTVCTVEGCEYPAEVRGWCRGHYQRVKRNGEPGPAAFRRSPNSEPPECSVEVCDQPAHSRGYCAAHYQRWYDGREINTPVRQMAKKTPPPCKIEGCDDPMDSRGWCRRHYSRWWSTGDPGPADAPRYGLIEVCSAEGCDRRHRTGGYCDMHYRRFRRGVNPGSLKFRAAPTPRDPTNYAAAHRKIVSERGPAKDYLCECGSPARQWAYQHNDPDALVSPTGHRYSFKSFECYAPMCMTCHGLLDRDPDEQARRAQKH